MKIIPVYILDNKYHYKLRVLTKILNYKLNKISGIYLAKMIKLMHLLSFYYNIDG